MSNYKVKINDKDLQNLIKLVKEINSYSVTVGVHGPDGAKTYEEGGGKVTVLDVANWNEFGTDRIRARSFIRDWVDTKETKLVNNMKKIAHAILKGTYDPVTGFERLGNLFVADVQLRIRNRIPPKLATSTVKRKKSSIPLINKGHLRSSIRYIVNRIK